MRGRTEERRGERQTGGRCRSVKFGIASKERVLKRQGINEGDGRKACTQLVVSKLGSGELGRNVGKPGRHVDSI